MSEKILLTSTTKTKRNWMKRSSDGKFVRQRNVWSLENFDDGYVDNHDRFRVWLPTHPRAYADGYILRSIVAYESYHNVEVPPKMDIHHKNDNRLDDSEENLVMLLHGKHTRLTSINPNKFKIKTCKYCENEFKIEWWRLKDPSRGQYCSQTCYHSSRRK